MAKNSSFGHSQNWKKFVLFFSSIALMNFQSVVSMEGADYSFNWTDLIIPANSSLNFDFTTFTNLKSLPQFNGKLSLSFTLKASVVKNPILSSNPELDSSGSSLDLSNEPHFSAPSEKEKDPESALLYISLLFFPPEISDLRSLYLKFKQNIATEEELKKLKAKFCPDNSKYRKKLDSEHLLKVEITAHFNEFKSEGYPAVLDSSNLCINKQLKNRRKFEANFGEKFESKNKNLTEKAQNKNSLLAKEKEAAEDNQDNQNNQDDLISDVMFSANVYISLSDLDHEYLTVFYSSFCLISFYGYNHNFRQSDFSEYLYL